MRTIGVLLIIAGVLGLIGSQIAFGDIGLSMGLAGVTGLPLGICFMIAAEPVNAWKAQNAARLREAAQARRQAEVEQQQRTEPNVEPLRRMLNDNKGEDL